MIRLRTPWTQLATLLGTVGGSCHEVETILIGEIEEHPDTPARYCRSLHVCMREGDLAIELWADTEDALELRNLADEP